MPPISGCAAPRATPNGCAKAVSKITERKRKPITRSAHCARAERRPDKIMAENPVHARLPAQPYDAITSRTMDQQPVCELCPPVHRRIGLIRVNFAQLLA